MLDSVSGLVLRTTALPTAGGQDKVGVATPSVQENSQLKEHKEQDVDATGQHEHAHDGEEGGLGMTPINHMVDVGLALPKIK